IRTANAFGVSEVLIVGKKRFHEFGAFDTAKQTKKKHFYRIEEAVDYLRVKGCMIYGVEIVENAHQIQVVEFTQPSGFMMGNEGDGLSDLQKRLCDEFVTIPQYGTGSSINVNVAAGIVLHHFAIQNNFIPSPIHDNEFIGGDAE
ncbi:MAG: TrmH family RNA methyltransferase, partial [Planctomycetota bacterium]